MKKIKFATEMVEEKDGMENIANVETNAETGVKTSVGNDTTDMDSIVAELKKRCERIRTINKIELDEDGVINVHVARINFSEKTIPSTRQIDYLKALCTYKSNSNLSKVNKFAARTLISAIIELGIKSEQIYVYC